MGVNIQQPTDYVSSIQESRVFIENVSATLKDNLLEIGGHSSGNRWVFEAGNEKNLAALLGTLRDYGVLFMGASYGWPPSAVFEHLRDKGLLTGNYRELIFWRSGDWSIYDR